MLVFSFHMAFGILLIALGGGILLYIKAKKYDSTLGKFLGIIIALLAVAHLVCTSYYGIGYLKQGYYDMPVRAMIDQALEDQSTTATDKK